MRNNIIEFIQSNRDLLDLILDLVPIPLFLKDNMGRYIDCNKAFTAFLSVSRENIIGKSVYELWNKDEADVFFAQDQELYEQGGLQIYETKITSADGIIHAVQFHKQVFMDSSGDIAGFLGAIFDITEKKDLEVALVQLAATDELTGLPNRRYGMAKLELLHKECERNNRSYCLAMIDIDRFKQFNDQYGHTSGDLMLKEFSKLAKHTLRNSDLCFRYGGEEFVLLLPETELDNGFSIVERLRRAWASNRIILADGQVVYSTLSIGLTQYPANRISPEQLLQASDKALYEAKRNGRNRTVCSSR